MRWLLLAAALFLLVGDKVKKFLAPLRGRITSKFGNRVSPHTGLVAFHNGVDIAAPTGSQIVSPDSGVIAQVYTTDRGGLQTTIDHPNGYRSGYAHLSKVYFGPGASVSQGKLIAESGSSGQVTGPHLHFTWKKNDVYQDPEQYFQF